MTALDRLRRTRVALIAIETVAALLWATAAFLATILLVALADSAVALPTGPRKALAPLPWLAALLAGATVAWRGRHALDPAHVALWVEERVPALRYALVTARELGPRADFTPTSPIAHEWRRRLQRSSARALLPPLAAAALVAALVGILPSGAMARASRPRAGDALARVPADRADRLTPLVARVLPPRYAGLRDSTVEEPTTIRALAGSTIELLGRGDAEGIAATPLVAGAASPGAGAAIAPIAASAANDDRWRIMLRVPAKPLAIRLTDARTGPRTAHDRTIVVEPVADAAPEVTLTAPARDSVLRAPTGRIALAADARDDFGITRAAFEVIVSSGEGENFTFTSRVLGERRSAGRGERRLALAATLDLASLPLKPGDILHLRAVARDANDATGPGNGASETRTLRIARAGEYDSVAVDAAPPSEAEKGALSQRMLIQLTEALEKRRRRLDRATLLRESSAIAGDQKRLRKAVGELVFMRLGGGGEGEHSHDDGHDHGALTPEALLKAAEEATSHGVEEATDFAEDETPVVAINKPLLEAYNAMWSASGELEQGATDRALPHMYAALAALQRARAAERIYLRGKVKPVVVDLAKARLAGERPASIAPTAQRGDEEPRARLARRFERVLVMLGGVGGASGGARRGATTTDVSAAADTLALLRVEALGEAPAFAQAVGEALEAMRRGRGDAAGEALARARRALLDPARPAAALPRWGGGW